MVSTTSNWLQNIAFISASLTKPRTSSSSFDTAFGVNRSAIEPALLRVARDRPC